MSDEAAFLAAIRATPGDDVPRLVYADWLQEHGRAGRAQVIRVQIELATSTPADERYCDLVERQAELGVILGAELLAEWPQLPEGWQRGPFRRGFPEEVIVHGQYVDTTTEELAAQLRAAAREMPLARLDLASSPGPMWGVLDDPVCERLHGLHCSGDPAV